jgi:putative nucleotidyltransferase with HDIG domain
VSSTSATAPSLRAAFEADDHCLSLRSGERAIDPSIEPMFEQLTDLCTLPGVAQRVIQIANDPNSDTQDLLEVVETDPAVAARLMQVVNSSYCGLRNPVSDLRSALTLLGAERVRSLAMTISIGAEFGRPTPVGLLDPQRLWDHSVCVATISRMIATRCDACPPEEAYLAGLVHDMGLLFVNQHLNSLAPRVLAHMQAGMSLPNAERHVLAFDHAQVGAYVAWRCGFPREIVAAIDYHHAPAACPQDALPLVHVVTIANYLSTRFGRGSLEGRRLPAPSEGILTPMGLNLLTLRELWEDLPDTVANVRELTTA